jgi:hypothetical protein
MANSWITALKKYNEKKGGSWCVPKKGSAEYEKVKSLMTSGNKIIDNTPVNPKIVPRSQLKTPPGLKPASGKVKKIKKQGIVIVKDKAGKAELAAIAEARKIGGSINRIPKEVAQEFKNVKPTEPVNVLVPRSLKKVSNPGSIVANVFRNIMYRFNIAENPKKSFVPGKLKKIFLDVVATQGSEYNVENKLIELLEEKGPRIALSYDQNTVPPGFKEAKIKTP